MRKILFLFLMALFVAAMFGCGGDDGGGPTDPPPVAPPRLVATTHQDPGLASVSGAVWDSISAVTVPIGTSSTYNAGVLTKTINAQMKALVAGSNLYIRAQWADNTENDRFGEVQAIKSLAGGSAYWLAWDTTLLRNEDRFYIMFGQDGPNNADCALLCHDVANASGHKMYGEANDNADVWHWKAHRTGLAGFAEDMHMALTGIVPDPQDQVSDDMYFRNLDPADQLTGEIYLRLRRVHVNTTAYTGPGLVEPDQVIWVDSVHRGLDWVPDWPTDTTGMFYPGYYLNPISGADGSRWDVEVIQEYSAGNWTVVFRRALNSGDAADVELGGLDSVSISIAIGDNNGMKHWGRAPFYLVLP